jgi:hypothetical protein
MACRIRCRSAGSPCSIPARAEWMETSHSTPPDRIAVTRYRSSVMNTKNYVLEQVYCMSDCLHYTVSDIVILISVIRQPQVKLRRACRASLLAPRVWNDSRSSSKQPFNSAQATLTLVQSKQAGHPFYQCPCMLPLQSSPGSA